MQPDEPRADSPADGMPVTHLLDTLTAEYPELSVECVRRALQQADAAASALRGGHRLTAALARDRLNLARERAATAARRTRKPDSAPTDPAQPPPGAGEGC